jgi:hypothetical protein
VGEALDCSKEQREHERAIADANARTAEAMANAAAAGAEDGGDDALFSPATTKALKIGGLALGGIAALALIGFLIVKV